MHGAKRVRREGGEEREEGSRGWREGRCQRSKVSSDMGDERAKGEGRVWTPLTQPYIDSSSLPPPKM